MAPPQERTSEHARRERLDRPLTRERPASLLRWRGAPTASCLLLAGRSPGPAGLSDEIKFGPYGPALQLLSADWTFVRSEGHGALGEDDDIAPDAHVIALDRAAQERPASHLDALVDVDRLQPLARVDQRHERAHGRAGRWVLGHARRVEEEAARERLAALPRHGERAHRAQRRQQRRERLG